MVRRGINSSFTHTQNNDDSRKKRIEGFLNVNPHPPSAEMPNDLGVNRKERNHGEAGEGGIQREQEKITALRSHDRPVESAFALNGKGLVAHPPIHVVHHSYEGGFEEEKRRGTLVVFITALQYYYRWYSDMSCSSSSSTWVGGCSSGGGSEVGR